MILSQLFGNGDWLSSIIWFLFFFVMIFLYPKLMIYQITTKIENEVKRLEGWSDKAVNMVWKGMSKTPKKEQKNNIKRFIEFFMVSPIDLDPRGIIRKLDHVVKNQIEKFEYFVKNNSDLKDIEDRKNIEAGLEAAMMSHQIAKITRHFLELVKKYKNLQIAMIIQMQLPMIKDIAKAALKGTEDLTNGNPIGDTVGPFVATKLIGKDKPKEVKDKETAYAVKKINGRKCVIVKASGPGARTGLIGEAVEKLVKKYKPKRIITIDAASKLEGEKTGSLAEGVGIAMGGIGVQRYEIEEIAVKKKIPMDAIAIKMLQEEAIFGMKEEIYKAVPEAIERVKENLERVPKGKTVMIIGVGNTCGVGNNEKSLPEAEKKIKANIKKMKKEEEEEKKKKKSFWSNFSPEFGMIFSRNLPHNF